METHVNNKRSVANTRYEKQKNGYKKHNGWTEQQIRYGGRMDQYPEQAKTLSRALAKGRAAEKAREKLTAGGCCRNVTIRMIELQRQEM